jgi:hypothetical protein
MTRRSPARNSQARAEPLAQHDQPLETGHRLEQGRGHRSRGNGQPRSGKAPDQMRQQTSRQHGIADAGRGHEQDAHIADLGALIARAPPLAKQGRALYL